jgi:hypothetical protein
VANQAMRQHKSPSRETSVKRRLVPPRQRPSNIEQTGPPPDDEEAARAAISQAFADIGEVEEEKGNIPSVEGSEGLAICRDQATELARSRFGGQVPDVAVAFVVDTVSFVNDHEAVVTYTAEITGSLHITLGGRPGGRHAGGRRVEGHSGDLL